MAWHDQRAEPNEIIASPAASNEDPKIVNDYGVGGASTQHGVSGEDNEGISQIYLGFLHSFDRENQRLVKHGIVLMSEFLLDFIWSLA